MKKCLLILLISTFSASAFAQKIKVRKVRGNQAVVEFSGGNLNSGQVYEIAGDDFGGPSFSGSGSRDYVVNGSLSFVSQKDDSANSNTVSIFEFIGKFGWNFGTFEVGPLVAFGNNDTGTTSTNSLRFGVFGDFNMIPNIPGEIFVYGLSGDISMGQEDSGTTKRDSTNLFVGPFVKWFPGGQSVAFRFDLGYGYQKVSGGLGSDVTTTGLAALAGIQAYF